jgi:hypothetical protein
LLDQAKGESMTRSASARDLAAQGVPRSEISRRLGITREAVRQAIGRKQPRPGRPRDDRVRVVLRLPRNLYDEARALQKSQPAPLHKLLVNAIAENILSPSSLAVFKAQKRVVRTRTKS